MSKKSSGVDYNALSSSIASGQIDRLYIFHGEERYLLEHSLTELRSALCPDGLNGFNYRRFETVTPEELEDAIDTLPVFAERTLIEVHDFDIFKGDDKERLAGIFSDLPDYVCVVFVYDTVAYKPDGRQKSTAAILKFATVVDFAIQEQAKLVKWITRRIQSVGKRIGAADAEYLAFITGGYMTALVGEIEKVAAYASGDAVTREDIDAVVTPTLDAVTFKLTDALISRNYKSAYRILDELLRMKEAPHRLIYSISLKMRQLLCARVCIENGINADAFKDMCDIKFPFQARMLLDNARKITLAQCRDAVLCCSVAAHDLNFSSSAPESGVVELVAQLAHPAKVAAS